MRKQAWVVVLMVAACGHSSSRSDAGGDGSLADAALAADAGPPVPKCLTAADRGGACTITINAQAVEFETKAAPTTPVFLRYDTAWDVPQIYPTSCTSLATANADMAGSFLATFDRVSCASPIAAVVAVFADDPAGGADNLAFSINDHHLPAGCAGASCMLGSTASPFQVWTLAKATLDAWKTQPGLSGIDWGSHGLLIVTFRNATGQPVSGVQAVNASVLGGSSILKQGSEVFYLSADSTTFELRTNTSASGTAVIPVVAGTPMFVTGSGGGVTFEQRVGMASSAGGVFFEQIDPQ